MTYFYKPATGLKADINRHREEAQELQRKIDDLEAIDNKSKSNKAALILYRHFLYLLNLSKAEAVSKIGKNK